MAAQNIVFDTLVHVKKLKLVGFTDEQAEAQVELMAELIEDKLATKHDLKEMENNLTRDIEMSKKDLKIWLGSMLAIGISVLAALITFVPVLHK